MVRGTRAHEALAATLGARATLMAPLGPFTTYGVGGPAAVLVEVEGPADLDAVRAALRATGDARRVRARSWFEPAGVRCGLRRGRAAPRERLRRAGSADPRRDARRRRASRCGAVAARPGPSCGRRRLVGPVVGGGRAGLGRWRRAHERRWPRLGHGGIAWSATRGSTSLGDDGGTDDVAHLAYGYRRSSVTASQLVVAAELAVTRGIGRGRAGSGVRHRQVAS